MPHRKTIREGIREYIHPSDHVLCIGPGLPFVDGTPLLAMHMTRNKGRVTVMDSQSFEGGKLIGTASRRMSTGGLDAFKRNVQRLKRKGAIKGRQRYVMGDIRDIELSQASVNAILEQNMLFGHDHSEIPGIIEGYDRTLSPGGRIISVVNEFRPDELDYKGKTSLVERLLHEKGFDVRIMRGFSGLSGVQDISNFAKTRDRGLEVLKSWEEEKEGQKTFILVATKPRK